MYAELGGILYLNPQQFTALRTWAREVKFQDPKKRRQWAKVIREINRRSPNDWLRYIVLQISGFEMLHSTLGSFLDLQTQGGLQGNAYQLTQVHELLTPLLSLLTSRQARYRESYVKAHGEPTTWQEDLRGCLLGSVSLACVVFGGMLALLALFPYTGGPPQWEWVIPSAIAAYLGMRYLRVSGRTKSSQSTVYPEVWPEIRAAVLRRDGYKCGNCPATTNLVVHHIVPLSKGGTNEQSNLRTLCESCHALIHPHLK